MSGDKKVRDAARETVQGMLQLGLLSPEDVYGAMDDFHKPAGQHCPYQKHHKGCTVYKNRPFGCRIWNCRWLVNDDTAGISRPDRSHYVIDIAPDFVTTDEGHTIPVIQIWVDKNYREAWRDPALLGYLKRRAEEGYFALIRFDAKYDCFFLAWQNGQWIEKRGNMRGEEPHTALERVIALSGMK
jgi:hypothetical protein